MSEPALESAGPVEIGLGLQSDKSLDEYARLGMLAEECGFDVLSVFSDLLFQPPLPALLAMARVTRRVRLGAACWNPYTVHPYEIAGQMAMLDHASGGRGYLGLARGSWLGDIGVAQPSPVRHLREAVALIRALLSGDDTGIDADLFPLAPGVALRYPRPKQVPPILIGTWGVQTAALAGEIADEVKVGGSANPDMVGVIRARIARGAQRVERAPHEVGVVIGAVTVVDDDGVAARRRARREVAMYLPVIAALDPTITLPPDLLARLDGLVRAGHHEDAGKLISDDVLDLFAFSGTPEQVAEQTQRVIDAGASRVEFGTPHGRTDGEGIAVLGRRVLPLLDRG